MGIHRSAADQPFEHACIESRRARFLKAEAASCLLAHGPQHVLLGARIILRGDFRVADADEGLLTIARENVGDSPDGETHHQETDQDQANRFCRALAQSVECHASITFSIMNCQIRAGVRW